MAKTLEELRNSSYHQQLGRKMCAAVGSTARDCAEHRIQEDPGASRGPVVDDCGVRRAAIGKALDVRFPSNANERCSGLIV